MATNLILTKESSESEIKQYFSAILKLSETNQEFPVNLDEVWMLVYAQKVKAVEALKRDFIEGEDFTSFSQKVKRETGGSTATIYKLSISCLEYFIAKKVRSVFEVYRQVFHKVAKHELSRKELALMVVQAEEEKEKLALENKALASDNARQAEKIEADAPKVLFAQYVENSAQNFAGNAKCCTFATAKQLDILKSHVGAAVNCSIKVGRFLCPNFNYIRRLPVRSHYFALRDKVVGLFSSVYGDRFLFANNDLNAKQS